MRYGLNLPNGGACSDARTLAEFAALAECSGWDGVFLEDYIVYQSRQDIPTHDPWLALAAMALRTQRIRLGTEVTPLARRRPWKLARETVTLDHLSNGRLILGVGLGASDDTSFTHFGEEIDAKRRAEMLDEGLQILTGLWSSRPVSYRGKHYSVDEVRFLPATVQRPRIPLWIGGSTARKGVVRRAARWDGIAPYKNPDTSEWQDFTAEDIRELRAQIENERTSRTPFDVVVGGRERREDWEQERALIGSLGEAGATWWVEWVAPAELEKMHAAIERGPLWVG
jgi:alkanesulfonate monooxygenase SsuD/methylene tetrahydromethanopterin reductase-like flavin-dependent oxidoreductase (luciferase family)